MSSSVRIVKEASSVENNLGESLPLKKFELVSKVEAMDGNANWCRGQNEGLEIGKFLERRLFSSVETV